ncbi:hypothetical protein ABZ078_13165 [Streptomyces sp. NPDC006385]|uniref:hypothetical protein n=1 Tax=Streptomyces sp. NPDC006385 TaxID=3156761 RepID=UPI0033A78B76
MRGPRHTLITLGVTGALMFAASAAPVQASVEQVPASGAVARVPYIKSTGGWIKTCYEATCRKVVYTYAGDILWAYGSIENDFGNRWYRVATYLEDHEGWIYCGNTNAAC